VNVSRLRLYALLLLLGVESLVWIDLQLGGALRDWSKPQPTLTMASILAGFLILTWQLNRQHRNTIESNAEIARNELKLEVYRDLATASQRAAKTLQKLHSDVMAVDMDLGIRLQHYANFNQVLPSRHTFQKMTYQQSAAETEVIGLMAEMEKWEIALGTEFQSFKEAIGNHLQQSGGKCRDYFWSMRDFFGQTTRWPPKQGEPPELNAKAKEAAEVIFDVIMDIWDLRIATQNRLLGNLFTYRVPTRKPGDSSITVLKLQDEPSTD